MQDMFPGVVLEELDAGHWVHSEAYVVFWRVYSLSS